MTEQMSPSLNVFAEPLASCGTEPMTGFFRDGCCNTSDQDTGSHTLCVELSAAFLQFSRRQGNDLSTPRPEYDFPGLRPGDRWCLCAMRWLEAHQQDCAPRVFLTRTHQKVLETIPIEVLKPFAVDMN